MKYSYERTKAALRKRYGIKAYRVLDAKGDGLIVRNPIDGKKIIVNLADVQSLNDCKTGSYIDAIFSKTGTHSHMIQVLGSTPPEFVPTNGEDVC